MKRKFVTDISSWILSTRKLMCSNQSKILYEDGFRIVPIFRIGYSRQLCLTRVALYSRTSYSKYPTANNHIFYPGFSTLYRCAQLRIKIPFQVGHLEQNVLLYGVRHSEWGTDNCICLAFVYSTISSAFLWILRNS